MTAARPDWRWLLPALLAGGAFVALFRDPAFLLVRDWWSDPDASHGLLLAPVAFFLAWKRGLLPESTPRPVWGVLLLAGAVTLRYLSELAAEIYTMRLSMLAAAGAILVVFWGFRQLRHWWLPATLLVLSVPLPAMVLESLALPLQLRASAMGAALLESRHVPVLLAGNVIHLPGQSLFVTEACSGLRSLTALLSLGVLMGGLFLRSPWGRAFIILASIPIAMAINGVRVFLTGFLVFFVDPSFGTGFMHYTEGWALFLVSLAIVSGFAWIVAWIEGWLGERRMRARGGLEAMTRSEAVA